VGAGEKGTVKKDLHEATPPYNDGGEAKGQGNKYMKSWLYSFYFFSHSRSRDRPEDYLPAKCCSGRAN
jgi:hypothetical protein